MRLPLAILVGALLALSGCGGDDGDGPQSPAERLAEAVKGFEEAVADQDCEGFARYAHTVVRPPGKGPDDPPDAIECRNLGNSYTRLFGFKSRRSRIFGSAAVVEGNIDGRFIALVWTLDFDGRWVQVQSIPGIGPQVRTPAERPDNRFAANAAAFLEAQVDRDCRAVFRLLNSGSPFLARADDPRSFCKLYEESSDDPQRLSAQLRQATNARPEDLGGTRDLHFFRVDTGRGRRWTLILSTLPQQIPAAGHAQDSVLDYFPNSR